MRGFSVAIGLLVVAAGLFLAASRSRPATTSAPGGNLPVNAGALQLLDTSAHNSPSLAHNPTDGANLVIANRIDAPRYSCALHVTLDGGAQWAQTAIPLPAGEEPKCYAPDVTFGADGTLYLSFVTLQGDGNVPHAAWLVRSNDKGRTLGDPSRMLGPLAFQVRLVADPTRPSHLYRSWVQAESVSLYAFPEDGNTIQFARSDDGGATWSDAVRVNAPTRSRSIAPSLDVGPKGQLYVLYLDLLEDKLDYVGGHQGRGGPPYPGTWQLVAARSLDGGTAWTETVVEAALVPTERIIVFIPPLPSLAVDKKSGRVFAAFQDGRLGDADVLLWSSGDGGKAFGPPLRVNDTPRGDGTAQYLPKLDVSPEGRLDVLYFDRRADKENAMNQVSFQSSFDGGRSFTRSTRLADKAFDSRIGFGSDRDLADLGNRLALASTSRQALAVWTDTRAGTPETGKQDLVRAITEITPPSEVSRPIAYALRTVAVSLVIAAFLSLAAVVRRRPSSPSRQTIVDASVQAGEE